MGVVAVEEVEGMWGCGFEGDVGLEGVSHCFFRAGALLDGFDGGEGGH